MRIKVQTITRIEDAAGREILTLSSTLEAASGDNPRFRSQAVNDAIQSACDKHSVTVRGALEAKE